MTPREIRDFYRENVDTLRSAFQEILHQHFLLLSAFVPEMVDSIKASLSESLTERSEDGERTTSALNTLLVSGAENAVFCQMPRETVISSIDVAKAIEFDFRYLEQGDIAALKDILDHEQEAFELLLTMIPRQLGIAREILDPFQIRMNALVQNSRGEKRFQVEYLKPKEDLMPTNLRLWIHKANVALDYLQDNNMDELLNQDVKSNALGRQRPGNQTELMGKVRSYLRSRQCKPDIVANYFQGRHVQYAA